MSRIFSFQQCPFIEGCGLWPRGRLDPKMPLFSECFPMALAVRPKADDRSFRKDPGLRPGRTAQSVRPGYGSNRAVVGLDLGPIDTAVPGLGQFGHIDHVLGFFKTRDLAGHELDQFGFGQGRPRP